MENVHDAAADGAIDLLESLLRNDQSLIGDLDIHGRTALHYAAREGQVAAAVHLLSRGAHVNSRDKWGYTPLMLAIFEELLLVDRAPIVVALIANGADVAARDEDGNTALHHAAYDDDIAVIDALIAAGSDINSRSNNGNTPLHNAVSYPGRIKVDALLRVPDVDLSLRNNAGLTPRQQASENGRHELADLIGDAEVAIPIE